MPLPTPNLDDLRFQRDLVDEARRRIINYCPEWTDYNLSDPGITLIELFAWMTELIVYRLNRVPDKNYIKFMELLGIQLQAASSARAELTFRLSVPFPINPRDDTTAVVFQGIEVATRQTEEEEEITFTTDERLVIYPPNLIHLRRDDDFHVNYLAKLRGRRFFAFGETDPEINDAFYLGFDESQDLGGHILQLTFECDQTQAPGINRNNPPLVWEYFRGNGQWGPLELSPFTEERDTTEGFNNPVGQLVLYLPLSFQPNDLHGNLANWIRCRIEQSDPEEQGMYTESPKIADVTAHSLGATTLATHAVVVEQEYLGVSNGEPNQVFYLQHQPILELHPGETVEVEERRGEEIIYVPWQRVRDFSGSDVFDRHFTLETSSGEIRFGPAIRQADGQVQRYGRVPEAGRRVRFSQYRYGGGIEGNVPTGRIQLLKSAIPYIDQVINLKPATGGRDPESLTEAKNRAQRELRAQLRAVTPKDYEDLAKKATRAVGRVKCNIPQHSNGRLPPGIVEILIVPDVDLQLTADLKKLHVSRDLAKTVHDYLDKYRLLTTTLQIREPNYVGVKVEAKIVPREDRRAEEVVARVNQRLRNFINPLLVSPNRQQWDDLMEDDWAGWPFGRDLYVFEIYSLIQRVPGVLHVLDVKMNQQPLDPGELSSFISETPVENPDKLDRISGKVLRVSSDTLLCSLDHEVRIGKLGDEDDD